ncbi:MAG: hypothetical protein WBD36_11385 [Bacteroidota bacterium]
MKRQTAVILLLIICLVLAVLLITQTITPIAGGVVFALSLATIGVLSRGFGKRSGSQ